MQHVFFFTQESDNAAQHGAEITAVCSDDGFLLRRLGLQEKRRQLTDQDLQQETHRDHIKQINST